MTRYLKRLPALALIAAGAIVPLLTANATNTVSFKSTTFAQTEDGGTATITILRRVDSVVEDGAKAVTVELATNDGTALAGFDYTAVAATVSFPAMSFSQTVEIPILDDIFLEGNETVALTLSHPTEASLGAPSAAELIIADDDIVATCGDGIVELGEECDDNNGVDTDACTTSCRAQVCGDGILGGAEECDDGNTIGGDCCSATCKFEDAGSACDDHNSCSLTSTCDGLGLCAGAGASCGDGTADAICGEQCDDSGTAGGDGCSATCQLEFCGDGSVNDGAEECDDGNAVDGDGCSAACLLEFCGDNAVNDNGAEECDDGNTASGDGCSATCHDEFCGDGTLGVGEECDDGNAADDDGCSAACRAEVCGDGTVNNAGAEECDDGNTEDGDGCSATCAQEEVATPPEDEPTSDTPTGEDSGNDTGSSTATASPAAGGCSLMLR